MHHRILQKSILLRLEFVQPDYYMDLEGKNIIADLQDDNYNLLMIDLQTNFVKRHENTYLDALFLHEHRDKLHSITITDSSFINAINKRNAVLNEFKQGKWRLLLNLNNLPMIIVPVDISLDEMRVCFRVNTER